MGVDRVGGGWLRCYCIKKTSGRRQRQEGKWRTRTVRMEPELEEILLRGLESGLASPCAGIDRHNLHRQMAGTWRKVTKADGTVVRRRTRGIIERAGFDVWPDPFHAWRVVREDTWIDAGFREDYVLKWLDHSRVVGRRHYRGELPDEAYSAPILPQNETGQRRAES